MFLLVWRIGANILGQVDAAPEVQALNLVEQHGRITSFAFMVARVLGCFALVCLSAPAALNSALGEGDERPTLGLAFGFGLPLNPYVALLTANVSALGEINRRRRMPSPSPNCQW